MALEKTNRINTLLSFYESLLSDKQRKYMNLYYREDLSLTEIADSFDVSRQAVSKWEQGIGYPEVEKLLFSLH